MPSKEIIIPRQIAIARCAGVHPQLTDNSL